MYRRRIPLLRCLGIIAIQLAATGASVQAQIDFNQEVRPILAKHCFSCHDRDAAHREAGLRLDTHAGAVAELDSGEFAIVPGQPGRSALIARVTSADVDLRMPPAETRTTLNADEINALREWIEQGAKYADFWSFTAPRRPSLPAIQQVDAARNAVDYFIIAKLMDTNKEPKHTQEAYGVQPGKELFANNCLLARRLVESGTRSVQLFHYGWDFHGTSAGNDIVQRLPGKCQEIDQPIAALINDLKQRGLFEETLIVLSGEFGRTSMNEERNGSKFLGRDHHPHCFSIWMAGGGIKGGISFGETDELGYAITENPMSVRDLQATIIHLLGFDPKRFSYPYQGLEQRLIGPTDEARVRHELLA